MYVVTELELTKQHRVDVARQVENNRLAREVRAARSGTASGIGNALLGRVFAWSPRKEQTAEC